MKKFISIVPRWFPSFFFMLVIFAFSAQPGDDLPYFLGWDFFAKKAGHVIGYGLLTLSYLYFLKDDKKRYWLAWCMAIWYSTTDEIHQFFVFGRHASIYDVVIFDNLGALMALWLHFKVWRKDEEKTNQT